MKSKSLLVLLAVLTVIVVAVGCSSVTQAPEIKVVRVTPAFDGVHDTIEYTIVFKNFNKVDGVINDYDVTFIGDATTLVEPRQHISLFIAGEEDSVVYKMSWIGMSGVRAAVGGGPYIFMRFSGADAYGYGKVFTDTCRFGLGL